MKHDFFQNFLSRSCGALSEIWLIWHGITLYIFVEFATNHSYRSNIAIVMRKINKFSRHSMWNLTGVSLVEEKIHTGVSMGKSNTHKISTSELHRFWNYSLLNIFIFWISITILYFWKHYNLNCLPPIFFIFENLFKNILSTRFFL